MFCPCPGAIYMYKVVYKTKRICIYTMSRYQLSLNNTIGSLVIICNHMPVCVFQLKKIGDSVSSVSMATFDQAWHTVLSEVNYILQPRIFKHKIHLSRVMRKPTFWICKNKDADQLRGNREADRRLCFRYIDSTIPLLSKSEISSP